VQSNRVALSATFAVGLLLVQLAAIRLSHSEIIVRIALPATIALVPLALWPHRRRLGVWVIFVGLAANLAAVLANGGLMPIEQRTVVAAIGAERAADYRPGAWVEGSKDVLVGDGEGHIVALGDSIVIRLAGGAAAASPGDIVVLGGVLLLAGETAFAALGPRTGPGARRTMARADGSATTPT
jgi:hypothetical protein